MSGVVDHRSAAETIYDAVVVGSGVSGSIVARQLAEAGLHVLVVEAGPGQEMSLREYDGYLTTFYGAASKDNNAPYGTNPNAPMPRGPEVKRLTPGRPETGGYLVQNGPVELDSTYTRVMGGTTMHWEGKVLRMLPDDLQMRTRYGIGRDWPISYEQLAPYYVQAEKELGASADVEDQAYHGIKFDPGYVYPMRKMPLSYLDQVIARDLDDAEVDLGGTRRSLKVRSTPQARNGIPHPDYDGGKGFEPAGAVSIHQAEEGGRCQGNINCVPICPVQAKYNARKTLAAAMDAGRVDLLPQSVAGRVHIGEDGRVSHVEYKTYDSPSSRTHTTGSVRGRIFVLAANPVENARLLLASGLPSSSGLVGRNLMDHAYLLTWGLMPEVAGTMRGPQCTAGIEDFRTGEFRAGHAAHRMGIHNDGWGWATGSPYTDLLDLVDNANRFGAPLRQALVDRISRQLLLACMVDLPPDPSNRVTVDGRYTDQLGNLRPVLSYSVPDYTLEGAVQARRLSRQIFQRLGVEDHTSYDPADPGFVSYQGEGLVLRGGNHWAGTHVMGHDRTDSVVDSRQRSWDHENLYLVGPGSMPSIGTSNTTLTLSALCFMSAEHMVAQLKGPSRVSSQATRP